MAKAPDEKDALIRIRVIGVSVILGLIVFVTVVDAIDGLFFGDVYHVDVTFYTLSAGLIVTFLTGSAIEQAAKRKLGGNHDDDGRS